MQRYLCTRVRPAFFLFALVLLLHQAKFLQKQRYEGDLQASSYWLSIDTYSFSFVSDAVASLQLTVIRHAPTPWAVIDFSGVQPRAGRSCIYARPIVVLHASSS